MLSLAGTWVPEGRVPEALKPGWDLCKGPVRGMCVELELLGVLCGLLERKETGVWIREQASKDPTTCGAQGYKVKREVCWGVHAARLERGSGYTKQEAGRTSHEVPQGRGIFYEMQRQWKSSTEERKGVMGRAEGLWGVQKDRVAIPHNITNIY